MARFCVVLSCATKSFRRSSYPSDLFIHGASRAASTAAAAATKVVNNFMLPTRGLNLNTKHCRRCVRRGAALIAARCGECFFSACHDGYLGRATQSEIWQTMLPRLETAQRKYSIIEAHIGYRCPEFRRCPQKLKLSFLVGALVVLAKSHDSMTTVRKPPGVLVPMDPIPVAVARVATRRSCSDSTISYYLHV